MQYLKSRPNDEQVRASLQFLLTAMGHIKKKNPLTESFLVQLDVDLAGMLGEGNDQVRFNCILISMSGSNTLFSNTLSHHQQITAVVSLRAL